MRRHASVQDRFSGKVAIVTGDWSGIGRTVAEELRKPRKHGRGGVPRRQRPAGLKAPDPGGLPGQQRFSFTPQAFEARRDGWERVMKAGRTWPARGWDSCQPDP